ncbi:MAG: hypothetical protein J6M39_00290 [Lachnospiraceae bacterium]|nr:hypothetical protein [Lachnospiraceae bacterium]
MKKKHIVIAVSFIIIMILFYLLFGNIINVGEAISKQIENVRTASSHDYSLMGDSYSDKIYEKYDTVTFGRQSDNKLGLFKKPIEWIVLDKKDNSALLISKYILDCKAFDYVDTEKIDSIDENIKDNFKYCDWSKSSLRKWLNNEFLNDIFSTDEQDKVLFTHLHDTNTDDKIFCLNEEEYVKYFDNGGYYEKGRDIGNTKIYYNGATKRNKRAQSYDIYNLFEPDETYVYWLRDKDIIKKEQGVEFGSTKTIGAYGEINFLVNTSIYCGVRPAMWVSLE